MLLNHNKIPVWKWDGQSESRCPDCNSELLARKGEYIIWHWAHYPRTATKYCWTEESQWHLTMKKAYYGFKNWRIEVPVVVRNTKYRIDAVNSGTCQYREFVHTLSNKYAEKHKKLTTLNYNVLWIYDGSMFASRHRRAVWNGGIKRLLKPKARDVYSETGGLVHFNGKLWREWKYDVWYPLEGPASMEILNRYNRIIRECNK